MGSQDRWVVSLAEASECGEALVGGKSAKLAQLLHAGFRVPGGFCVTAAAYERFLSQTTVAARIAMELGRKPLDAMRWEEMWDAALRIRSEFLRCPMPRVVSEAICQALAEHVAGGSVAVRSSAPGEDSRRVSFAGLHESVVGVEGEAAVLDAVRTVWASLWSDAALLYRRELSLDPLQSRMAVLIQEMKEADCSGVAFARDPREPDSDCAVVEAVPGPCALLVDGEVDPDRWILRRCSGELVQWQAGRRGQEPAQPLLDPADLAALLDALRRTEALFGWAPDVEWTGRGAAMVLLQARPITTAGPDAEDDRTWYLSLRPGVRRLAELAKHVTEDLIPDLERDGARLAAEDIESLEDARLADAIDARLAALQHWKDVYWEQFIPLAHGVRQLARYYNDAVRPDDPYEFVGLLHCQDMLASRRNQAIASLAGTLRANRPLREAIRKLHAEISDAKAARWRASLAPLGDVAGGGEFLQSLDSLLSEFMDISYGAERLRERPDLLLHTLLELSAGDARPVEDETSGKSQASKDLEQRFFAAVGPGRREEAAEVLRIGKVSWRLRDDDNLLLSRIESQLLRAVDVGAARLRTAGRLREAPRPHESEIPALVAALRDPAGPPLALSAADTIPGETLPREPREKPRQLVGQPAAPGIASGKVRRVTHPGDLKTFRAGEVLVCDAIQPMMTHLVPLAAGIVERRGGMLIHGAIIAREMRIPCVNGIAGAVETLADGDLVTVDGHLGIVTVGLPEFDLELR